MDDPRIVRMVGGKPGSTKPGAGSSSSPGQQERTSAVPRWRRRIAWLLVQGAHRLGAGRAQISQAELRDIVAHSDALNGDERRLIDEVIAAGHRHVRELMVPRTDVVFLDASATVSQAAQVAQQSRHSRFPVIDGSHDDVVGFVHLRDLLIRPAAEPSLTVAALARPVRSLPASKGVLAALSEMRREGDHLAVVVDEYGGTAGIVTLEDLIEELVGEIHDEYDATPEPGDGTIPSEVDGLLNLNDFAERAGFALPPGPYETVSGFLMARLGRLPALGDEVALTLPSGTWRLSVVGLEGRRASRVALFAAPPADLVVPQPDPVADLVAAPATVY
jgi:putative hemolysin